MSLVVSGDVKQHWTMLTHRSQFVPDMSTSKFYIIIIIDRLQQSPGEIKRREVVLDPYVSPEETKGREMELGLKVGLLLPQLLLNSEATDIVTVPHSGELRQQLRSTCTLVAALWREDTAFVVVAAVHGILGLSVWRLRSSPHSFFLFPLVPVPNRPSRLCGR